MSWMAASRTSNTIRKKMTKMVKAEAIMLKLASDVSK